jgi:CheY-like chemotaxis protein
MHSFVVTIANNGKEALEILEEETKKASSPNVSDGWIPISIILLDIMMPVMGGEEAIRLIRAREKSGELSRHYPVIAVTGNARQEQVESFKNWFDAIAIKPYKMNELLVQINTLLGL